MNCPQCQEALPALPGAKFCPFCGHELPAGEMKEPKLLTCSSCGNKLLTGGNYCPECGQALAAGDEHEHPEFDPKKRLACSDGMCIGIIGPDGKCNLCGKPYSGKPS